MGAIAGMLGRTMLEVNGPSKLDDERWKIIGPLATLLHAMPVIVLEPAPGETVMLPELDGFTGPVGLVLDKRGGVSGPPVERAFTMSLKMPDVDTRVCTGARPWRSKTGSNLIESVSAFA